MKFIKTIQNKKGIGLPTMLAIVSFVLITIASLLSYTVFQANQLKKTIEFENAYLTAVNKIETTLNVIIREQNLDADFLENLEAYMGVEITLLNNQIYRITYPLGEQRVVSSYITNSATPVSITGGLLNFTGQEDNFDLNAIITPIHLLTAYLPTYYSHFFPLENLESSFESIDQLMNYIKDLAINTNLFQYKTPNQLSSQSAPSPGNEHWFVDGNVTIGNNKTLFVPDGYILFINGDLTMSRGTTLLGNVIINGNVRINRQGNSVERIRATLYIDGNFTSARDLELGTVVRPTYIFAEGQISFTQPTNGHAYLLSQSFIGDHNSINITGGIYTHSDSDITRSTLTPNTNLDESTFYDYAIPSTILTTSSENQGEADTSFVYTAPNIK